MKKNLANMSRKCCHLCATMAVIIAAFCAFSSFTMPGGVVATENVEMAQPFAVSVVDTNGSVIQGYHSPEDGIWYIFLPCSENIANIRVKYTGNVVATSKGTLEPEAAVISGAFAKNGDSIILQIGEAEVCVKVMQSILPSVQISLSGITLSDVHADKNKKFQGNSLIVSDPNGNNLNVGGVEFKGRGNSTWALYDKKGFQIKFSDKTSVLGMEKAKKWVLLANSSDDSMMRNMLGFDLATKMDMPYTTQFKYVDLWIDGDYRGTYIIGEKVEIGGSRVALKDDKGVLMEQDAAFYMEEDYWIYDSLVDTHYTVKESVTEDDAGVIKASMGAFQNSLDIFMQYLYTANPDEITLDALGTMIDVDSFAKYYLINEYTLNRESNHTSLYWYKDGAGDVLHLGPVWDFDTCMGNEGIGYTEYYAMNANVVYNRLLGVPAFYNRVVELQSKYRSAFKGMAGKVDSYNAQISASAQMNYIRWNVLGSANPKGGSDFAGSYKDAVSQLRSWLVGRSNSFKVQKPDLSAQISEDRQTVTIVIKPTKKYGGFWLPVWSSENGQDDLKWYSAEKQADGTWTCVINLEDFESKGIYFAHLYGGSEGPEGFLSGTCFFR